MKNFQVIFEIEFDSMILELPVTVEAESQEQAVDICNEHPEIWLTKAYAQICIRPKATGKAKKSPAKKRA